MYFLSHTVLKKIINNWFRTNIPFIYQISSSFILLGSKQSPQHPDRQITTNVLTRYLWYNCLLKTSVQPSTVLVCKTQLRLHSLMTMMSWLTNGNVHLYKVLEVIKIQFTTKGDIKEKSSGQISLQDLLGKKASLLLVPTSTQENFCLIACTTSRG